MTTIEQILAKDIGRPLDGVVKASNSAQLSTEVSEYVITDEVAGHLTDLLEAYTFPGGPQANGVWIAGFFGSGKSHLLKMLAYLLGEVSGSDVARADVVRAFIDKVPVSEAILRGALERSASIPARSLLFNIDEKVDKNEKDQADALLKVFLQVFYDAAGFFGRAPHVAQFERDLIRERTNAGLKAARERGSLGGRRPVITPDKLRKARDHIAAGLTVREAATRLKVGKTALYKALEGTAAETAVKV